MIQFVRWRGGQRGKVDTTATYLLEHLEAVPMRAPFTRQYGARELIQSSLHYFQWIPSSLLPDYGSVSASKKTSSVSPVQGSS